MSARFLAALALAYVSAVSGLNDWPIIGIFTQPTDSTEGDCGGSCTYIAASYVKQWESAGARVVPIDYYASEDELDSIFNNINGVMFPGGDAEFPQSAQYIFDKVIAANDAGDYFPLWGTCMGFVCLLIAATRDSSILDPKSGQMDSYNYSIPLDFTTTATDSKLFANAPSNVMDILSTKNVTMNNHHYGIWTTNFKSNTVLSSMFNLLSTNNDRNNNNFVSMMEAYKYPIFGSQWHPEKNSFEWGKEITGVPKEAINHSPEAVLAEQYVSDIFVQHARKNSHSFPTPAEEDAALIYSYTPSKTTGSFVQSYFFHVNDEKVKGRLHQDIMNDGERP